MPIADTVMEQHPISRRNAVFDDDGISAWLYLTRPNSEEPVRDCWLYNRIAPPPYSEIDRYRGGQPPAPAGYAAVADTFTDWSTNAERQSTSLCSPLDMAL
jgi:hypothetical protein